MARACELFAMDVENRSELVMEDRGVTKGETFKHKRYMSPHLTDCRSSLAGAGVVAAVWRLLDVRVLKYRY